MATLPTLISPNTGGELRGTAAAEKLLGRSGNDLIDGGDGRDYIYGAGGNDSLFGGVGGDVLDGGLGHDTLNGGEGDDLLYGYDGDDRLIGGPGNDMLMGGLGKNVFVFGSNSGLDTIADFIPGEDKILIEPGTGGITKVEGFLSHLKAAPDGTAILDFGGGNAVTLIGVSPSELTVADFGIFAS